MIAKLKTLRWEASATIAAGVDWFDEDIAPINHTNMSKFTLQMFVPTAVIVEIDMTDGTTEKTTIKLNGGDALVINTWYQFDIMVPAGYSFNIQHAVGTLNVTCMVFETELSSDI